MSADALLAEVRDRYCRHGLAPNAGARRRFGRDLAELSEAQAAELLAALRGLGVPASKLEASSPFKRRDLLPLLLLAPIGFAQDRAIGASAAGPWPHRPAVDERHPQGARQVQPSASVVVGEPPDAHARRQRAADHGTAAWKAIALEARPALPHGWRLCVHDGLVPEEARHHPRGLQAQRQLGVCRSIGHVGRRDRFGQERSSKEQGEHLWSPSLTMPNRESNVNR